MKVIKQLGIKLSSGEFEKYDIGSKAANVSLENQKSVEDKILELDNKDKSLENSISATNDRINNLTAEELGALERDGNGSNLTVTFNESATRTPINGGESLSTLFSKIKRWLSDLKAVAFSGSYNDLSDKPSIPAAVAVKGNKETAYRTGNVNLTPANIGAVNLTGDTMQGNLIMNNITLWDGVVSRKVMQAYDDGDGLNYGSELVIGGAGNTFLGSGESQDNLRTALATQLVTGEVYGPTGEALYFSSDSSIYFYTACQTIANRKGIIFDSAGMLRPISANVNIDLGTASIPFGATYLKTLTLKSPMTISAGKVSGLVGGTTSLYSNGIAISNPTTPNDVGWIRVTGTGETDTVLEIATGDDGGTGETIVVRQYTTSNTVGRQLTLFDTSGNTTIPGSLILTKTTDAAPAVNNMPALIVGGTTSQAHLELDNNEIIAKSNATTAATLYLNNDTNSTCEMYNLNVNGTLSVKYPNAVKARYIDGSNSAELYLNYNNPNSHVYCYNEGTNGEVLHTGNFLNKFPNVLQSTNIYTKIPWIGKLNSFFRVAENGTLTNGDTVRISISYGSINLICLLTTNTTTGAVYGYGISARVLGYLNTTPSGGALISSSNTGWTLTNNSDSSVTITANSTTARQVEYIVYNLY